jgi:DNA-binding CsgD family transcriptional regulator/steroid 5-alpha reductase family enzyme
MGSVAAFPSQPFVLLVASLAIGAGMACLFMAWEQLFSIHDGETIVGEIGCAAVVSSLVFLFVSHATGVAMTVAAVLVAAACLVLTGALTRRAERAGDIPVYARCGASACRGLARELWKPTLCVAAYGFVHEVVRSASLSGQALVTLVNSLSSVGILASGVVLLLLFFGRATDVGLMSVYRVGFPLAATGFALMPFLGHTYQRVFVAFMFMAFSVLVSLLMVSCAEAARRHGVSPVCVFGVCSAVVYLFAFVGSAFGGQGQDLERFGASHVFVIAFFSMYLLALIYFASRDREQGRADAEEAGTDAEEHGEQAAVRELPSFEDRCRLLADRYALTPRERDVFMLYAAGRDTPAISERLSISENTVRTHERGFYRKMDVHSKQELLDLVEKAGTGVDDGVSDAMPSGTARP